MLKSRIGLQHEVDGDLPRRHPTVETSASVRIPMDRDGDWTGDGPDGSHRSDMIGSITATWARRGAYEFGVLEAFGTGRARIEIYRCGLPRCGPVISAWGFTRASPDVVTSFSKCGRNETFPTGYHLSVGLETFSQANKTRFSSGEASLAQPQAVCSDVQGLNFRF